MKASAMEELTGHAKFLGWEIERMGREICTIYTHCNCENRKETEEANYRARHWLRDIKSLTKRLDDLTREIYSKTQEEECEPPRGMVSGNEKEPLGGESMEGAK